MIKKTRLINLAFALIVAGCGGNNSTAPRSDGEAQLLKISTSVVQVPEQNVKDYIFSNDTNEIVSNTQTILPDNTILKIGEKIIKIDSVSVVDGKNTYKWSYPTLDEAYDEIFISIPILKATVPVMSNSDPTQQANKTDLSCSPKLIGSPVFPDDKNIEVGIKVTCTTEPIGALSLSVAATISVIYEDLKIIKIGKASLTTQEWRLSLQLVPEVGISGTAKNIISEIATSNSIQNVVSKSNRILGKTPECFAAGLFYPFSNSTLEGGTFRQPIGSLNVIASSGVVSVAIPTCFIADLADSKIGIDFLGKGKWKFSAVKYKNSNEIKYEHQLSAELERSLVDSIIGVNLTGSFRTGIEIVPTILVTALPAGGLYINPGVRGDIIAKASPLKQGVCANAKFDSKVEFWTPLFTVASASVEVQIVKDKLLLGNSCDPNLLATTTSLFVSPQSIKINDVVTFNSDILANSELKPTGTVTFFERSGVVICVAVVDSIGHAACSSTFSTPGIRTIIATYSGDTKFGTSFSPDLSINVTEVLGDYAIEVAQIHPGFGSEISCALTVGYSTRINSNSIFTAETCTSNKSAVIRCIGSGCTSGRFFVSILVSRLSMDESCVFPSNPYCLPTTHVQENYGADPIAAAAYISGPFWYGLGNGGWVKAWPSISSIRPNVTILRNIVIDTNTGDNNASYMSRANLDIVYNVYDSINGSYSQYSLAVTVP